MMVGRHVCAAVALLISGGALATSAARYALAGPDIVRDSATRLEWTRADNGRDVDWIEARSYCRGLGLPSDGWRLPSSIELQALVQPSREDRTECSVNGAHFTCPVSSLFRLTSPAHWSGDLARVKAGVRQAWVVHLIGRARIYDPITQRGHQRALCVRSGEPAKGP